MQQGTRESFSIDPVRTANTQYANELAQLLTEGVERYSEDERSE